MAEFFKSLDPYVLFWLIAVIVFAFAELSTVTLTSIWFAAGSLVALVAAALGASFFWQIIAFIVTSFALLYATRPWAKKFVNTKKVRTNADRAIGEEMLVQERVSNLDHTGMAIVNGQEWTLRTEDDQDIIEKGELVRVLEIKGVKLIVERVKED